MKKSAQWIVAAMITAGALAACDSTREDWQAAQQKDTQAAYEHFLSEHPQGDLATQARTRLDTLRDESDWRVAREADSVDAYQSYLEQHRDGAHAKEASARIDELTRKAQWNEVKQGGDEQQLQAFIERHPGTAEAVEAQKLIDARVAEAAAKEAAAREKVAREKAAREASEKALSAAHPYGVQLAAVKDRTAAGQERDRLEKLFGTLIGASLVVETPAQYGSGSYYRIRSAPMSETDARKACERLQQRGQSCLVFKR